MGVAVILLMWPRCREQTFAPPTHGASTQNLAWIGQAVLEEKKFEYNGHIHYIYIHVYGPRTGTDNPLVSNF